QGATLPSALATGALVVEDVAAGAVDETALFHLLNLAREQDAFVLLTARAAPVAFAIRALASRLKALPLVGMAPPDDALLRAVLVKLFTDRQLAVDEGLVGYLARRIERSFAAARAVVARLDAEAMRHKRPLTRASAPEPLPLREPWRLVAGGALCRVAATGDGDISAPHYQNHSAMADRGQVAVMKEEAGAAAAATPIRRAVCS